jgi:hypothetical protein
VSSWAVAATCPQRRWRQSTGAAGANTSRPPAVITEEVSHGPPAHMLVALAVAALLLVGTASAALAGITAWGVD